MRIEPFDASVTWRVTDPGAGQGEVRANRYTGTFAGTLDGNVEGEGWDPDGGPHPARRHLVVLIRLRDGGTVHGSIRGGSGTFGVLDFDTAE